MPECTAQYVAAYLFEIGPVLHGGMGDYPLTHSELRAWMDNTGVELTAWEARTIRRLSMEYLSEQQRATTLGAAAPWQDAPYVKVDPAEQVIRLQRHIERLAK